MTELRHKFTDNILFKMLFFKHPHLLKKLVASLLKIELDSISVFKITSPEIVLEPLGDKLFHLDMNMLVNGHKVNLEIQVNKTGHSTERSQYYWAREFSKSFIERQRPADLPRTILISILTFKFFPCEEYHSEYRPLEVMRHKLLSDRMVLHCFELPKLPEKVTAHDSGELWLSLLRASTEEDLAKLEALDVPEIKMAIKAYRSITVTLEFREVE